MSGNQDDGRLDDGTSSRTGKTQPPHPDNLRHDRSPLPYIGYQPQVSEILMASARDW